MKKVKTILPLFFFAISFLLGSRNALATTYIFNGAFGNSWSFSWNWPTGMPPNPIPAGDNVMLNAACNINTSVTCNGSIGSSGIFPVTINAPLTINAGGVVNIANLNNYSTFTINGIFIPTISFSNYANVLINSSVSVYVPFNNEGSLTISAAGNLSLIRNASNAGILTNYPNRNVIVNGQLTANQGIIVNNGQVLVAAGAVLTASTGSNIINNFSLSNSGTINIGAGCLLRNTASLINQSGGILMGWGTMTNDWIYNGMAGSIISPGGGTTGQLNILGSSSVNLLGNSTYRCDIKGTNPGTTCDYISMSGIVTLTNASLIVNWGSFTPVSGQNFTIINCGARNGQFASVFIPPVSGIAFSVIYNSNSVVIRATAVLPLTLTEFSGTLLPNDRAQFKWAVKDESNVLGYELQASEDGSHFYKIGFVAAKNSSHDEKYSYEYLQSGRRMMYRLKMIDIDEIFSLSKTIILNGKRETNFTLFPNPATDFVTIDGLGFKGWATVYSLDGRQHLKVAVSGNRSIKIDTRRLLKGTYLVRFDIFDSRQQILFIKQ